ncbi:enoyl-CoA hydratase/isomerase family protein [Gulosibacter sediminis]|uniref:enoyl-CoA hydratase/isomerase family protein n=1 Tax=Gulosibacter sediminis TaxID=1729695 RepID=UPI0024ACC036|nr:enoyl-CoA hydratase/isomerase family protein [Gulosibacter sediminis]
MTASPVLFDQRGHLGLITLNRPRQLNALSFEMLRLIGDQVDAWLADPSIRQLALVGAGDRALCAGGDIAESREAIEAGTPQLFYDFLGYEYRLDVKLNEMSKPYVTLMDGITFGGGLGLSAHASHRIVTERSRLGMPEVRIGYIPDVGGSWRLAVMPGEVGMHLALTAGSMGAGDAIEGGLADAYVASARLAELLVALETDDADAVVARFSAPAPAGELHAQRDWIDAAYRHELVEDMLAALGDLAEAGNAAAGEAAASIQQMSPTSLVATARLLRDARKRPGLRSSVSREYRVGMHLATAPDFREGVRARVVDKDNNPQWQPARLEDVAPAEIERLFATDATAALWG